MGAERAGARVLWATDSMPEAAVSIEGLLPHVDFELADIQDIKGFPRADLVLGGYPCQPFSMGGARNPVKDKRAQLFREFGRAIEVIEPPYFVAENVVGLRSLGAKAWLSEQLSHFRAIGQHGYHVSVQVLDAADFGVPQRRRRLFLVGVRKDLDKFYRFPAPTHGPEADKPWVSHGDALAAASLPGWPTGEFYERPDDPDGGFSWWYMSRNRKAPWDAPARTVLANERHVSLHPASPTMRLVWSNLADGTKQGWEFTGEHEHTAGHPERMVLEHPRRLSWRECAILQSFPPHFEPYGSLGKKYEQIGNAVPPALAEAVVRPIFDGTGMASRDELTDQERIDHLVG